MVNKNNISRIISTLFVIDQLSNRPEHKELREQLIELEARVIHKLCENNFASCLGFYNHRGELKIVYEVICPKKGSFYFFQAPNESEPSTLPIFDKNNQVSNFKNPIPYYIPSLNFSLTYLYQHFPKKTKKKQNTRKSSQCTKKLRNTFVSRYLDSSLKLPY